VDVTAVAVVPERVKDVMGIVVAGVAGVTAVTFAVTL
jgi:hypothetical protein